MTDISREDVREGIKERIPFIDCDRCVTKRCHRKDHFCPDIDSAVDEIIKYLKENNVAIKVVCPKCEGRAKPNKVTWNLHTGYCIDGWSCPNCRNMGYTAWEELID